MHRDYKRSFSGLILSPCLARTFGCSLSLDMAQAHVCFAFAVSLSVSPDILPSLTQTSKLAPFQTSNSRYPSMVAQAEGGWEIRNRKDRWTAHLFHLSLCSVWMSVCLCVCLSVCCGRTSTKVHPWKSEDNLGRAGSLLPLCGPRRLTWTVRLCSRHLYSISPSCQPCSQISTSLAK